MKYKHWRYFELNEYNKLIEIKNWCEIQFGPQGEGRWNIIYDKRSETITRCRFFTMTEENAVLFTLMWV